jgi:hypothetical protein
MEYNYLFFTQRYKVYRNIINVTIHLQLNSDLLNKTKRMANTDISLDVRRSCSNFFICNQRSHMFKEKENNE